MNPFTLFSWLIEYWWIFAIVAGLALVVLLWTGVVQIAAVVVALAKIAAATAKFFATPPEQIAEKILWGIAVFVVGASIFYQVGKHDERGVWEAREVEHAAAMKRLALNAAVEADAKVKAATEEERKNTQAAEQKANTYAEKLKGLPVGACGLDDSDLAAGGVSNPANGADKRRHPK